MADEQKTESENDNSVKDMTQGITALLGPVVMDIDKAIVATRQSQEDLGKEIERLIAELELFTTIAEPPKLQPALEKLRDARKRLALANKLMHDTQARVDKIQSKLGS